MPWRGCVAPLSHGCGQQPGQCTGSRAGGTYTQLDEASLPGRAFLADPDLLIAQTWSLLVIFRVSSW